MKRKVKLNLSLDEDVKLEVAKQAEANSRKVSHHVTELIKAERRRISRSVKAYLEFVQGGRS